MGTRKTKETEDNGALALLTMIHDRVQKSKHKDRYIVTSHGKWGVTDSQGKFIIPMVFSLIQTSNDRVFRVYGEPTGYMVGGSPFTGELKEQAVYDYDGNCIIPMGIYDKVISLGKFGLIFGQSKPNNEFKDSIKVLKYTGEILNLANQDICLSTSAYVPNMIIVRKIDKRGQIDKLNTEAIMLDTDKIEIIPYEESFKSIVYPNITGKTLDSGEISSDIELSPKILERIKSHLDSICYGDSKNTEYAIGKTNSGDVLLHKDGTLMINAKDKKSKLKYIFNGTITEEE